MTLGLLFILGLLYLMVYGAIKGCQSFSRDNLQETAIIGTSDAPMKVEIKESYFDIDKIIPYVPQTTEKLPELIFRPRNFKEYIGQYEAKEEIKTAIKITQTLGRPAHILLNGFPGTGKTTLGYIVSNVLGGHFIKRIANQVSNPDQIIEIINEINSNEQTSVLFLDEIHNLQSKLGDCLLEVIEDFKIANIPVKPFVCIGATTDKDVLVANNAPLVDRFQCQVSLRKYNEDELVAIIRQYKDQLYPNIKITDEDYKVIAKNAKRTPRLAISLLLKQLVENDIVRVLKNSQIIKDGLTNIDIDILKTLNSTGKAMGAEAVAQSAQTNVADYKTLYEPYLVGEGYVARSRSGRIITAKGITLLGELK